MHQKELAIRLLQVVALVLPAVAIYFDVVYRNVDPNEMDDRQAANYHATRNTFALLVFAAFPLLIELLWAPQGLEKYLVGTSIGVLGIALLTFLHPILLNADALSDRRGIFWPYRNGWHNFRDSITTMYSRLCEFRDAD